MIGNYKISAVKGAKIKQNVFENTVIITQRQANVNSYFTKE